MVKLKVNEDGQGAFYILEGEEQLGEMVIGISGNNLTAYHTEVSPRAAGKGYAKKLLDAMVDFSKENGMKVIPRCTYVHTQFKRHPEEYGTVWNKE